MKVKDLIEKLQAFDPETLVVVGGFDEEGYADIETIDFIEVELRKSQSICGAYQESKPGSVNQKAVLIDHG